MITQAFDKIEDAVVDVCSNWKIPEDTVRADYGKVKPHLNHALLIVANFANNHPELVGFLCSYAIMAIIPKSFQVILRPILRLIGLSRMGPVKWALSKVPSLLGGLDVNFHGLPGWPRSQGLEPSNGYKEREKSQIESSTSREEFLPGDIWF